MINEWGEEGGAPDKHGGKGQPPLQLMPCSGEEEGEEGRKYKERKGIFQVEEEEWLGPSDRERKRERAEAGVEGGKSSGPSTEEEIVWQKLYNTNRKTVLVWKQEIGRAHV